MNTYSMAVAKKITLSEEVLMETDFLKKKRGVNRNSFKLLTLTRKEELK